MPVSHRVTRETSDKATPPRSLCRGMSLMLYRSDNSQDSVTRRKELRALKKKKQNSNSRFLMYILTIAANLSVKFGLTFVK